MHANDNENKPTGVVFLKPVTLSDAGIDMNIFEQAVSAFRDSLTAMNMLSENDEMRVTAWVEKTPRDGLTGRFLLLAENQDFVTWKSHDAPRRAVSPDDVRVSGFMADARYLLESLSTVTARHLTEAEVEQAVATQLYDLVAIMLTTALALAREEPEPITTAELLARCLEGMP